MRRLSKAKWCLLGCLITVLMLLAISAVAPNELTSTVNWVANSDTAYKLRTLSEQKPAHERTLIEMVVETVRLSEISYQPVVILKEKDGRQYLPIWIGFLEANAILVILERAEVLRPLTPDLLCSVIDITGATVEQVVIHDLRDGTFYASITLKANWKQVEVDARPSDAIAVALRAKVPIYVEAAVLDKAGIQGDEKIEKYTTMM